jgi:hypothetical protein
MWAQIKNPILAFLFKIKEIVSRDFEVCFFGKLDRAYVTTPFREHVKKLQLFHCELNWAIRLSAPILLYLRTVT